jgi:hypothetical protein
MGIAGTLTQANAVATDSAGNVYVAGNYTGNPNFNPGGTPVTLTSAGQTDIFVAKYAPSGLLSWVKSAGGALADTATGIAVDASGNVYVTGTFQGLANFNPSGTANNLTSESSTAGFVATFSSSGSLTWVVELGATGSEQCTAIAVGGPIGYIYVVGSFSGTAYFGRALAPITSTGVASAFVAELAPATGNGSAVEEISGTGDDVATGVALGPSGALAVTGSVLFPKIAA